MRNDCSVILLAGGRSRRMGTPKAWLEFDNRPLLAHLVERMQRTFPEVLIVAAPDQELPATPARILQDERPGEGPVAGMAVGLGAVGHAFAFVSSCDAPFLSPEVAEYLREVAGCYDVAVPEWEGRLQPLHAVYRASVQPVLAGLLAEGRRRPVDLFDAVRTVVVPQSELRELDPVGLTFLNMNTPDDYRRACELWASRSGPAR